MGVGQRTHVITSYHCLHLFDGKNISLTWVQLVSDSQSASTGLTPLDPYTREADTAPMLASQTNCGCETCLQSSRQKLTELESKPPCFTAFTNLHLLGVSMNTTHLNSSNLGCFLSSKTPAGSLTCTANDLNRVDRGGNGQCEPVTVNLGCQIKSLSKCPHLVKPFSLRLGIARTWPSEHMAHKIKGQANEICVCRAMKGHL